MNKLFDRIGESNWFMKVIAFALALLLFLYVYDGSDKSNDVNVPSSEDSGLVEDMPVKVYYDTDNLIVSGVPETVDVKLTGPTVHVQSARLQKNFEVYVDLTDAEIGTKEVALQVKDLSDKLEAVIDPATIEVTLKEKVSKEVSVEAEYNSSLIAKGYSTGTATISPSTVTVTGAKDEIDKIAYVKANVELEEGTSKDISKKAEISALDSSLNKLDVEVEPETVEVNIPVTRTSKTVPINIVEKGDPPANVTIDSITLNKTEATISGPEDILKEVDSTRVEVDLSDIDKDQNIELPVIISNGVTAVEPELVTATVKVTVGKEDTSSNESANEEEDSDETATIEKTSTRTISGIPISIQGLGNEFEAEITDPVDKSASLDVTGANDIVKGLAASDFSLFLDLTGMSAGEHEVQIMVEGPDDISWELAKETASVSITEKDA
ncbi:CdaR family protein [Niallia taxi]|uniref:YbbR-like domain-containing protein n=1 Tax=Niallia taxi TaxID=2499688 RepID=A0A437K5Y7_9BACI|nr:CdaR family protein [Niallia taxi]MCM3217500.1 CdaR family protein [Niallia taxi]MDK8642956.1 CdaR family protein [Niallia taxi]MED4036559.1 CdaR family protein [Niallia taxi]MED4054306.1 CdaR family protein [Niallia taxi]MED4120419.1 CdaR family protein [Niallia taxi]